MKKILFFPINADTQFQNVSNSLTKADDSIESHFLYLVENENSHGNNSVTIDELIDSADSPENSDLRAFEVKHSLCFNDILAKNKLFKNTPEENDLKQLYFKYLFSLERHIEENKIDVIFCSCISDAITYGTYLLSRSLKIPFLYPMVARVSEHLYLADSLLSGPVSLTKKGLSLEEVEKIINETFQNKIQPSYANFEYLMIKKGISLSHFKTLYDLFKIKFSSKSRYISLSNGIINSIIDFFRRKFSNRELNKVIKFNTIEEIQNTKFIYWPLHFHPEAGTIILGRWIHNQYEILKCISRVLPHNVKLLVKEHRGSSGRRDLGFYKEISSLPGVEFVNQEIDTFDMINFSVGVAVITGTAGLEAVALNQSVMTFGDVHYNKISSVVKASDLSKIRDSVNELISNEGHDRREVVSFFSEVLNDTRIVNNFEGPNSSHECIEAITDLILSYKRHC